jgi:hypothetical protein
VIMLRPNLVSQPVLSPRSERRGLSLDLRQAGFGMPLTPFTCRLYTIYTEAELWGVIGGKQSDC